MKPNLTELNKKAKLISKQVLESEKGLLNKASSLETKLNTYVLNTLLPSLDIKGGRIVNSTSNIKLISSAKGLRNFLANVINAPMSAYYMQQFSSLDAVIYGYFNSYEPSNKIKSSIDARSKVLVDTFLESLFANNQILSQIQSTLRAATLANRTVTGIKKTLDSLILGKENKFGIIKHYHYGNGYDEMQKYTRSTQGIFADTLQLNYAIYQGGEIKTTRDFCESRNGKVFTREEIESWNNLDWSGKIQDGDVLIDAGGYNCRHDYTWISYELAKRVNPNIEKSVFDK